MKIKILFYIIVIITLIIYFYSSKKENFDTMSSTSQLITPQAETNKTFANYINDLYNDKSVIKKYAHTDYNIGIIKNFLLNKFDVSQKNTLLETVSKYYTTNEAKSAFILAVVSGTAENTGKGNNIVNPKYKDPSQFKTFLNSIVKKNQLVPTIEFGMSVMGALATHKIDESTYNTLLKLPESQQSEIEKITSQLGDNEMASALKHISTTINNNPGNLESAFKSAISDVKTYLNYEIMEEESESPASPTSPTPSRTISPTPSRTISPTPSSTISPTPSRTISPTPSSTISPTPQPPAESNCPKLPIHIEVIITSKSNSKTLVCVNNIPQKNIHKFNQGKVGYYKNILVTTQDKNISPANEWVIEPRQGLPGRYKIKNKYYNRYLGYGKIYKCDKDKNIMDNGYQKLTDTGRAARNNCPDKAISFTPIIHTASHASIINQNYKDYTWAIKCKNPESTNFSLIPYNEDNEGNEEEQYLEATTGGSSNPLYCQKSTGNDSEYNWNIEIAN